jgi:hypothetical protein
VFTLATLFLALLAGAGAWQLTEVARRWARGWGPKTGGVIVAAVGTLLFVGVVGEGAGHLGHPVVPQPAKAEIGLPGPVMDLPTDGADDRVWQYFSTDGFYKIPVGNSTFDMPEVDDLRGGMSGFPDKASIEKLPGLQAPEIPEPPDPVAAAAKPVAGLGVTRQRVGDIVIYEIGPGPKALHGTD